VVTMLLAVEVLLSGVSWLIEKYQPAKTNPLNKTP
jgi:hypothetical protein